jgi:hypothetical protein
MATPYLKFKDYYGVMHSPILIRDQNGRWIPVKPYPMAVVNQRAGLDKKPGLYWRYSKKLPPLERTDDAWGYVGTFDGLSEFNTALLWVQLDKLSHKYGLSRSCDSCHASVTGEQRQEVTWEYSDVGSYPFNGGHTVVADKAGLFIRDMHSSEPIEVTEGYKASAFAPWLQMGNVWRVPGDFSLPEIKDRKLYERVKTLRQNAPEDHVIHKTK